MRIKDILILDTGKDGGPKSKVDGFWLIRIKSLFTVAVLRFDRGSREAFHSHAFNSISWVLKGRLREVMRDGREQYHHAGLRPIITKRETFHKVYGIHAKNWVLTFRGPWSKTWQEIDEQGDLVTLTHDRVVLTKTPSFRQRFIS